MEKGDGKCRQGCRSGVEISRRNFLKVSGIAVIAVGAGGLISSSGRAAVPVSRGYLIVDMKKCQGCATCMLSCSLVHEGFESLSLARIQIVQEPFEGFPEDITISQCRQCEIPGCVAACPTGALDADSRYGNVRTVDTEKCIGCRACVAACPFTPGRSIWNFEQNHAQKCDLCADTPYWNEEGGPGGKQACVTACPLKAICFTAEMPVQTGDDGYSVDLRGEIWQAMGYPRD